MSETQRKRASALETCFLAWDIAAPERKPVSGAEARSGVGLNARTMDQVVKAIERCKRGISCSRDMPPLQGSTFSTLAET